MDEENIFDDIYQERKKITLVALGFIFFAMVIVFFYFIYAPKQEAKTVTPLTPPGNTGVTVDKKYNYTGLSKESCSNVADANERQKCFDDIIVGQAVNDLDFEKCKTAILDKEKNDCMETVARDLKDYTLCQQITDDKTHETCISDVAYATKDPGVCDHGDVKFEIQECRDRTQSFIVSDSGKRDDIIECTKIKTLEYGNLAIDVSALEDAIMRRRSEVRRRRW